MKNQLITWALNLNCIYWYEINKKADQIKDSKLRNRLKDIARSKYREEERGSGLS